VLRALGEAWPSAGAAGEEKLSALARNALVAAGRDAGESGRLAELARAVVRSGFWQRAMGARRRLFEAPFSVRVDPGDEGYGDLVDRAGLAPLAGSRPVAPVPGAPVFLSGAIDLVFLERDGWVIADYKTDRLPGAVLDGGVDGAKKALDALVDYYRPQVLLYSRFWAKITGDRVKESGLYFTSIDAWVKVGGP